MDLKVHIGSQVQRARRSAGFNQDALASALGRSTRALSSIETGRALPSLQTLQRVAKAVDKPLTFFFPAEDAANPARGKAEQEIADLLELLPIEDLSLAIALLKALTAHSARRASTPSP